MKRIFVGTLVALSLYLEGCSFGFGVNILKEIRDSVSISSSPIGRNSVVVTCPLTAQLSFCEVIKFDHWTSGNGQLMGKITPGAGGKIHFSGTFQDQQMTLQVRMVNDRGVVVGVRTRVFYAYDFGNSGNMQTWEVY